MAGVGFLQSLWEKPVWEGVWPYLNPLNSVCVCSSTASMEWNVPRKYGPHGELFFFLVQMEPATVPGSETFSPFFNADSRTPFFAADVLKECALAALHVIAEAGRDGKIGCRAPGLGDEWKMGCPKSPMWESEGAARSEEESVSSSGSREGNVSNEALHVISLHGPGDKISLFFKDWELANVTLSCHMALDMLCQDMRLGRRVLPRGGHGMSAVCSPWTGCDNKGIVVRGNKKWKGCVAGPCGLSGPVGILPFNVCSVHLVPFFGMCALFQMCLCVCA